MSQQLRRLKAGERIEGIPAATWNAFVDAAQYVRKLQHGQVVNPTESTLQTGIVWLKNTSGQVRNRFDVLGISDVFPSPTDNLNAFKSGPVLHGVTPAASHHGQFAVLLEPAAAGDVVAACIDGVCVAKVLVDSGKEWIEYADVKDGDAGSLQLDLCGTARVLWRETGTGVKWAVVRLGVGPGQAEYRGKLDAPGLTAGGSATVSIWRYTTSDADTGVDVTAHDWLLPSGVSLDIDTPVVVKWYEDSQKWYVSAWQQVTQTVVSDYQYDTGTNKFQKKTISLTVPAKATESGWTDVFTATTMTVQSNIQVDGANSELEKKTVELTVLEKATESGWTVFHTGNPCP